MCAESYKCPAQDNLMYCMFVQNECLTLPPPSPENNVTCRAPVDAVVNGVDDALMQGTWYVTHGYNRDYDCFAC